MVFQLDLELFIYVWLSVNETIMSGLVRFTHHVHPLLLAKVLPIFMLGLMRAATALLDRSMEVLAARKLMENYLTIICATDDRVDIYCGPGVVQRALFIDFIAAHIHRFYFNAKFDQ